MKKIQRSQIDTQKLQDSRLGPCAEGWELGEKEEGREKAHPLTLFYLQTVFTLYFHIANQASDLSVQNPMTTTYLTGHLTSIANVPAPRWCPPELKQKPIFKPSMHFKDDSLYIAVRARVLSRLVVSNSLPPHGLYAWDFSAHGIPQAKILEWVAISSSRGNLPDPRIELESPESLELAGGFFTTEPSPKPRYRVSKWS